MLVFCDLLLCFTFCSCVFILWLLLALQGHHSERDSFVLLKPTWETLKLCNFIRLVHWNMNVPAFRLMQFLGSHISGHNSSLWGVKHQVSGQTQRTKHGMSRWKFCFLNRQRQFSVSHPIFCILSMSFYHQADSNWTTVKKQKTKTTPLFFLY